MTLFYAPLQQTLMLSEKIKHFFLLCYLSAFCVYVQKHSPDACLGWQGGRYETCLDGNSFEPKYWYKKQIWKIIGRKGSEVKEIDNTLDISYSVITL